jgi:hypothetical protein
MDNLRCVSCGKSMSKHYLYCYKCHKDYNQLNNCQGVKINGDPCMLKTAGTSCIYHSMKVNNVKCDFVDSC